MTQAQQIALLQTRVRELEGEVAFLLEVTLNLVRFRRYQIDEVRLRRMVKDTHPEVTA